MEYAAADKLDAIKVIIIMGRIKNDDIIVIISPRIFSLGGRAIFMEIASNHIIERDGIAVMGLLIRIIFRLLIFSYVKFVNINRHEDVSPWVSIIIRLPYCPSFEFERAPTTIRPMCPTDEYAISAFRSVCRRQRVLVIIAPIIAIDIAL